MLLIDWVMEGRNLIVNRDFLAGYLNDFQHKLFTMSWKPIMLFKLERVCCKDDTPTDMQTVGNQAQSYEQVTNTENTELLLQMNRRCLQYNPSNQLVTQHGKVSDVLVATPLVGTFVGNSSSISIIHHQVPYN